MNKKIYLPFLLLLASFSTRSAMAQTNYLTTAVLDVNNIAAAMLVHGDMWCHPAQSTPGCEYPKGSDKNIANDMRIWMGGYDSQGGLHMAAQTYRQNGNEYWPGPLDANGQTDNQTVQKWACIWKIDRATIDSFKTITNHTIANTPKAILEWPAKGNPYAKGFSGNALTITEDMAPFIDIDNNTNYNPLNGDYPEIKGDQMLWLVYNDAAFAHGNTGTDPIHVEVQVSAYGYNRGTAVDNILYYEFKLLNKSSVDYDSFRVGFWSEGNLGNAADNYIGFDSVHRMGIVYNADFFDDGATGYGYQIPIAGVSMVHTPGDAWSTPKPAGSFTTFEDYITTDGIPQNGSEFFNLMHSRNRLGTQITNPWNGHPGTYIYPDDPHVAGGWSECALANYEGYRRFVIASNDFVLAHNSTQLVSIAPVVQPGDTNNSCGKADFTKIKTLADTALDVYNHPLPPPTLAVQNIAKRNLNIYPNPATETLFITGDNLTTTNATIMIYDAVGRNIPVTINKKNNQIEIDIHALPNGIYTVLYRNGDQLASNIFVKN